MFNFEEELKKLPPTPGVYIMHDKDDTIIYVGKAISLRNRVRSYCRESTNKSPKIEKMGTKIARFEYIVDVYKRQYRFRCSPYCLMIRWPAV